MNYLTNRLHVAVHLSSNRSQMTSKCGKNKKVAHVAIAECVTDVLTTFWRPLWSITGQMHGNRNPFVLYNKELKFVRIKAANISRKARESGAFPILTTRKKPFGVSYDLYQMKQSHWLLCAAKDGDWSRKITPLSNLSRASPLVEWHTQWNQNWTAKSTNLKEILDNPSQFLSSEQPSEVKNLDVALSIAGVVKIRSENLQFW